MCKPHRPLVALSLWFMIGSLAAETTTYVTVGKYKAHPTHILAKYKNVESLSLQTTAATLSSMGVTVKHHVDLVPGLVVLDSQPRVGLQSTEPPSLEAQASNLIER